MAATEKAGAGSTGAKRGVGRPRRLEPEQIVAVARRILQDEGAGALSMRRVAKELGVTPMALYHHVRDKDELLMLTLAGTSAVSPRPELPADPQERMVTVALHMHELLRQQPWVVDVLGLGELTDKGALWMVEEIIDSAVACGLTPESAVRVYRVIWYTVYGDLSFRNTLAKRAEEPHRARHFPGMLDDADAAELPRLAALADRWDELTQDYDFGEQLAAVIDGLVRRGRSGR